VKNVEHQWKEHGNHFSFLTQDPTPDRPALGYLRGSKYALMIDAGASFRHAELFREHLEIRGNREPDFVFVTHWHWDHVFGLGALDVPILSHEQTRRELEERKDTNWKEEIVREDWLIKHEFEGREEFDLQIVLPQITFSDRMTLDLGGVTAQLVHVNCDHTPDSSILFSPEAGVVFLGDCLYCAAQNRTYYYREKVFLGLLEQLLSYDATLYVDSHRDGIPREKMETFLHRTHTLSDSVSRFESFPDALGFLREKGIEQDEESEFLFNAFRSGRELFGA